MNKYIRFIIDSAYRFKTLDDRGFFKKWSDERYLKAAYRAIFHRKLDLDNPQTFNEKLNWLKLNDRREQYSILADKYLVKKYVADIIGEEYVVPCYGAWNCFDEIDFGNLPEQFVLKANHDSSGATICTNKLKFDINLHRVRFNRLLSSNYFYRSSREWPYKNIKPMVLAEKLLVDGTSDKLRDYKFWCFNGVPHYMYCTIKGGDVYENFFDMAYEPVEISHGYTRLSPEPQKPVNFELMKELAAKLSSGIPFVRVDFFEVEGKVYFGEFTFYDWGGMKPFVTYKQDLHLGNLLDISLCK